MMENHKDLKSLFVSQNERPLSQSGYVGGESTRQLSFSAVDKKNTLNGQNQNEEVYPRQVPSLYLRITRFAAVTLERMSAGMEQMLCESVYVGSSLNLQSLHTNNPTLVSDVKGDNDPISFYDINKILCTFNAHLRRICSKMCCSKKDLYVCKLVLRDFQSEGMDPKEFAKSLHAKRACAKQIRSHKIVVNAIKKEIIEKHPRGPIVGRAMDNKQYEKLKTLKLTNFHVGNYLQNWFADSSQNRDYIYHIDKLVSVIYALKHSANYKQFLAILNIYLGIYYDESIVVSIFKYFEYLFNVSIESVTSMSFQSDTFDQFKSLLTNWQVIKHSETTRKFHKFLSMILTVGLCKVNNISFSLSGLEIFHMEAEKRTYNLTDIIEVTMETAIYFLERGHEAFAYQDPWRLFFTDEKLLLFEKEYVFLVAHTSFVETGDWDKLGCTEQEFEMRVEKCHLHIAEMIKVAPSGSYRNILNGKLLNVEKLRVRIKQSHRNTSIRVRPFSMLLHGGSGVGKTSMLNYINNYLLRTNDFPSGPEYVCTLNAKDKYQSDYFSSALIVILDDIANSTPQATEGNPCQLIIDFINNDPKTALKADVDSKGAIVIQPKIVIGTTNKKDLDAYHYSNEPVSISRRFDYTIHVEVKPEFIKPGTQMLDPSKMPIGKVPDVWNFTVEIVIPVPTTEGQPDRVSYQTVVWRNRPLTNVGFPVLLQFLGEQSKLHFAQQSSFLKMSKSVYETEMCRCGQYGDLCSCEPLVHINLDELQVGPWDNIAQMFHPPPPAVRVVIEDQSLLARLRRSCDDLVNQIPFVPGFLTKKNAGSWWLSFCLNVFKEFWNKNRFQAILAITPLITFYLLCLTFVGPMVWFPIILTATCKTIDLTANAYAESVMRFAERHSIVDVNMWTRKKKVRAIKLAGYGVITVSTILAIRMLYRRCKKLSDHQGSECMMPTPGENEKVNSWKKPYLQKIDYSEASKTTTTTQLIDVVSKHIAFVKGVEQNTGRSFCSNIFPMCSNIWLINGHALGQEEINLEVLYHDKSMIGANFTAIISPLQWVHIPDSDLALVYIPSGGDKKNMLPYLPSTYYVGRTSAALITKLPKLDLSVQRVNLYSTMVECQGMKVKGYGYKTQDPTFEGMCMSPLITDTLHPQIVGFHFAGITGQNSGGATYVTRDMIFEHISYLRKLPGVLASHSSGVLKFEDIHTFKNIKLLGTIHPQCPSNYQIEDGTLRNYGAHDGVRRTFTSAVVKTVISPTVERVMGVPNKHGPPKGMNGWKPWHKALTNYVQPHSLSPTIMGLAYLDFTRSKFRRIKQSVYDRVSPLNNIAILSGADGVYGIDSINMASGAGHPFNCAKTKVFTRTTEPVPGCSQPIIAEEWFWEEVSKMEAALLKGDRIHLVFKAHLKDEPVALTKDKVRVFTGSSIVALALVRKYYLPLCKIIMDNPYLFECAVGINAHGPEWNKFVHRVSVHGKSRMVAGDYKSFDATMPASLTLASFRILIDMAKKCGYSEDQIVIMEGLATEMCYPLYEFNGSMIGIHGSNPSGHPLTVFINSLANSLYLRYAYYSIYEFDQDENFDDHVSLQCYGDDNIFSVSEDKPDFNHTSIAEALAKYDVIYTMAEKDQASIPYIDLSECTFLKRHMVYNSDLGLYLGPLEESSLFKTLHCVVKSDVLSSREQSAECIKSTLQEWFLHGREKYELRRTQLLEVIRENDMGSFFHDSGSDTPTYDAAMQRFRERYLEALPPPNPGSGPLVGELGLIKF